MKVGIVGSRKYKNEKRIFEILKSLNQKFDQLEIVSGGQPKGVDGYAKKAALSLNINYSEFPPKHYGHNRYCVNSKDNYNKEYHVTNFFIRNSEIAQYADIIIAVIPKDISIQQSKGTHDTVKKAKKLNKQVYIKN